MKQVKKTRYFRNLHVVHYLTTGKKVEKDVSFLSLSHPFSAASSYRHATGKCTYLTWHIKTDGMKKIKIDIEWSGS